MSLSIIHIPQFETIHSKLQYMMCQWLGKPIFNKNFCPGIILMNIVQLKRTLKIDKNTKRYCNQITFWLMITLNKDGFKNFYSILQSHKPQSPKPYVSFDAIRLLQECLSDEIVIFKSTVTCDSKESNVLKYGLQHIRPVMENFLLK